MDEGQRILQLRGFLEMDPANVPLACDLFDALAANGDVEQAVSLLRELPSDAQADVAIRFRQARGGLMQGRYADAAMLLSGLIEEGHEGVALWHDLAFAHLCLRDTAAAGKAVTEAEARLGSCAALDVVAARIAMMEGDFARALERLDRALGQAPDDVMAQGVRALALLDGGETDAAFAAAKACLARHSDQHEALLVAGTVALWRQALEESEAYFARALQGHADSGRCLSGLGQVRMLQGRLDEARGLLERAVAAMPDHIGTWHSLAWTNLLTGNVDAAEACYSQAYDLDHNFADSHGGLALIHVLRGRDDEGELAIKRALRLDPHCSTALYARTLLLEAKGRDDDAMRLLGQLVLPIGLPEGVDLAEFARVLRARFRQSPPSLH